MNAKEDYLNYSCRSIDPEEIEKLMSYKKHNARKKLIRKFLIKSYYENFKNISNKYDDKLVRNSWSFLKLSGISAFLLSVVLYRNLFTGVFEFRNFYYNMSLMPKIQRLILTGFLGCLILDKAWMNYSYNFDIYEIAVGNKNNNKV